MGTPEFLIKSDRRVGSLGPWTWDWYLKWGLSCGMTRTLRGVSVRRIALQGSQLMSEKICQKKRHLTMFT